MSLAVWGFLISWCSALLTGFFFSSSVLVMPCHIMHGLRRLELSVRALADSARGSHTATRPLERPPSK
jgi:hypothetical protein